MEKVLLIADEEVQRRELAERLIELGHQVSEASSSNEGLAILDRLHGSGSACSLVLCELHMKGAAGRDFLVRLRGSPFYNVPIILVTLVIEKPVLQDLVKCGVDGVLCRPFSIETLKREMEAAKKRRDAVELRDLMKMSGIK